MSVHAKSVEVRLPKLEIDVLAYMADFVPCESEVVDQLEGVREYVDLSGILSVLVERKSQNLLYLDASVAQE